MRIDCHKAHPSPPQPPRSGYRKLKGMAGVGMGVGFKRRNKERRVFEGHETRRMGGRTPEIKINTASHASDDFEISGQTQIAQIYV